MSEYQAGRTSAVFAAGTKVEDLSDTYEREAQNLDAMKVAFGMAGKTLENYRASMLKELEEAKIPLKEAEYGKVYITRCVELMRQLFNDTEAKRLQAKGAAEGMRQAVSSIKRLYDEERAKLSTHEEYENDPNKEIRDRPVGVSPGNPLEEYKKSVEKEEQEPQKKKRGRSTNKA
jgi:hypothetical protein